jgi:KUP system potassium uptake protein
LILRQSSTISNPFFLLVPNWGRLPMVILATAATVIASQAVISGAYSVSRQASQLGVLPPLTVRQTSEESVGQVYLPRVNAALFVGVLLSWSRSRARPAGHRLRRGGDGHAAHATVLMLLVRPALWHWSTAKMIAFGVIFGGIELTFLAANLTKIAHGGWLPLLIAAIVFTVMTTWYRGRQLVTRNRTSKRVHSQISSAGDQRSCASCARDRRLPHPTKETTPLALRANVEHNSVLHEHVVIFSTVASNVPHVGSRRRSPSTIWAQRTMASST